MATTTSYCYLPLYIFASDQTAVRAAQAGQHRWAAGALDEVKRIVAQLRTKWARCEDRAGAVTRAFCREELMAWCERETTSTSCSDWRRKQPSAEDRRQADA